MGKKYSFIDLNENQNWSWQELNFGLERNYIDRQDIIKFSLDLLSNGINGFDFVLDISIADEYEDIAPYVSKLIDLEPRQQTDEIENKWRYFILQSLYDKRNKYESVNEIVEEIYSDFDYPEDMAGHISYMPSTGGKGIEESWKEYLDKERMKLDTHEYIKDYKSKLNRKK